MILTLAASALALHLPAAGRLGLPRRLQAVEHTRELELVCECLGGRVVAA